MFLPARGQLERQRDRSITPPACAAPDAADAFGVAWRSRQWRTRVALACALLPARCRRRERTAPYRIACSRAFAGTRPLATAVGSTATP